MKNILFWFIAICFIGCATKTPSIREIDHKLVVKQYNMKYRSYLAEETKIRLVIANSKDKYLEVEMTSHTPDAKSGSLVQTVRFLLSNIDDYIGMIDRYISWERLATSNAKMEDRILGEIDGYDEGIVFALFSGTTERHYLALGSSPFSQHYDLKNAIELRTLLVRYKHNEL